MYLGQVKKGIVLLIGAIILSGITYGTLALPIWIAVMVDAYRIGRKLYKRQSWNKDSRSGSGSSSKRAGLECWISVRVSFSEE